MLVKLMTLVNNRNILCVAFLAISLDQRKSNINCDNRKSAQTLSYEKTACKILVKLITVLKGKEREVGELLRLHPFFVLKI